MNYQLLNVIECKQGAVRKVRFNVDGSYCLTAGSDKTVKLWNPHRKLFLKAYSGHSSEVLDVASSCDSSSLLSCSADKSVIYWDVATGKPIRRFRSHASKVNCVKFNDEATLAVSGSHDNTVMIWDLKSYNVHPIQVLRDGKDSIESLLIRDNEIISASFDCKIRCYDIRQGKLFTLSGPDPIVCLSLTGDGQCFLVSTTNSVIYLFDKANGDLLAEYTGHNTGEYCLENGIDLTDSYVLSCSIDGRVYCWDMVKGTICGQLEHEGSQIVHSLSVHPLAPFLMTASSSNISLWGEKSLTEDETFVQQ